MEENKKTIPEQEAALLMSNDINQQEQQKSQLNQLNSDMKTSWIVSQGSDKNLGPGIILWDLIFMGLSKRKSIKAKVLYLVVCIVGIIFIAFLN